MRTPSRAALISVLALVGSAGCGSGGDHASGGSSSGAPSGSGGGSASTSGAGGASSASSSGAGGASASSGSGASTSSASGAGGAAASTSSSGSASTSTSSSGSGGAGGLGSPCTWPQACDPGLYCDAPGCGAGTCAVKPGIASVSNMPAPVCGCDHITYWNSDNAAYHGASLIAQGACPAAMSTPCDAGTPCPGAFACNRKVASQPQCAAPTPGTCWSMPVSCPANGPAAKACSNNACASACLLIQSQNPYWDDGLCP